MLFAMLRYYSKVDSNKLWRDVQNEEAVICAKFGKDLFNISKVIGRKTKWPRFFGLPGIYFHKRYKDIVSMLDCWIPSLLLTIAPVFSAYSHIPQMISQFYLRTVSVS